MYLFLLYLVAHTITEVDLWDPTDYQVQDRAAEIAKLINLVHNTDNLEVKYPIKANDDDDENKDADNFDIYKTLRLLQKNYDVSRKFNYYGGPRDLHISNPEVLNAYKEENIPESRTEVYDDLSDQAFDLGAYKNDLERAGKITMHQLPRSGRKYNGKRAEMNLEMDYSDSSDDTDTSEEDDATEDEKKDDERRNSEEHRQMQMDTVDGGQETDTEFEKKVNKHVLRENPLPKTENTSKKTPIDHVDTKLSQTYFNVEKLQKQLSKLILSSNEKDTLNSNVQDDNPIKGKLYNTNENNSETDIDRKRKLYDKKDSDRHKKNGRTSEIDYPLIKNEDGNEETMGERSELDKKNHSNIKGRWNIEVKSEVNEKNSFSKRDEWNEKDTSWNSRAISYGHEKNDNDDMRKKDENSNNKKEKWNDKHDNSNKNDDYDKTIYDRQEKQDTRNKKSNLNKSDERWGKTDNYNKKDENWKETDASNERYISRNKKTDNWNDQNGRLYKQDNNWTKKSYTWKKKDNSWDAKGNSRDNNDDSMHEKNDSWYKKHDSKNKGEDSSNKKDISWNKKDNRDEGWNKKRYRDDSWNKKDDSRNKENDSWNKKYNNWNKKDDRDDSWNKKDDSRNKGDNSWSKKDNNWNKKDDRDDSWNKKDFSKKKYDDSWSKKDNSWNKKDDRDGSWNKKDDSKNKDDDNWNKKTDSWNKKEEDWTKWDKHAYNEREDDDWNVKDDHFEAKRYKKKTNWDENENKENLKTDSILNKKSIWDNVERNEKAEWGNYALFKHLKDKKNSNAKDYKEQEKRKAPIVDMKPLRYDSREHFAPRRDQSYRKPKNLDLLSARTPIPFVGRRPVFD